MSIKPLLIAIYSPAMGSGKTEVAKYLNQKHGYQTVRFASTLKAMVWQMLLHLGLPCEVIDEMVSGDLKEKQIPGLADGVTPRRLMQTLGTEWGRNLIQDDLWVTITMQLVENLVTSGQRVVIDDLRFGNEYAAVFGFGLDKALLIKLVRPGVPVATGHVSEGGLENCGFDVTITNDGTINDLRDKVDGALKGFKR